MINACDRAPLLRRISGSGGLNKPRGRRAGVHACSRRGVSPGGGDEIDRGLSSRNADAGDPGYEVYILFAFGNHRRAGRHVGSRRDARSPRAPYAVRIGERGSKRTTLSLISFSILRNSRSRPCHRIPREDVPGSDVLPRRWDPRSLFLQRPSRARRSRKYNIRIHHQTK